MTNLVTSSIRVNAPVGVFVWFSEEALEGDTDLDDRGMESSSPEEDDDEDEEDSSSSEEGDLFEQEFRHHKASYYRNKMRYSKVTS